MVLSSRSTSQSVDVGIIDDNIFERSETFFGWLIPATSTVLPWNVRLEPNIAVATIVEDKREDKIDVAISCRMTSAWRLMLC